MKRLIHIDRRGFLGCIGVGWNERHVEIRLRVPTSKFLGADVEFKQVDSTSIRAAYTKAVPEVFVR